MTPLGRLVRVERRRQRRRILAAGASAAIVAASSVLLLGVSGWFISAAALAGGAGASAALAFNSLLPSACIRLLAILRTGCRYSEKLAGHDAALHALASLRPALFRAIAAMPPVEAIALTAGDTVARLVQDVDEVEQRFIRRIAGWGALAAAVTGGAVIACSGAVSALATAGAVLLAAGGLMLAGRCLAGRLAHHGSAVPAANGRLRQSFANLAGASSELRAYGLEQWAIGHVTGRAAELLVAQRRVTADAGWFGLLHAIAMGGAAMLALWLSRSAPVPLVALASLAAAMTVEGMGGVLSGFQRRGRLHAAEARLDALFPAPVVRRDEDAGAVQAISAMPAITLHDPAIRLAPGSIVGIAGRSGCGKTTLIGQLQKLRPGERGRIKLDGVDLEDLGIATARRCFSTLPQDAALLAGSVRDNLLPGDPEADESALWSALHAAALDRRVLRLPFGLQSWLGEDGARLSGGERRRLALARCLLRRSPWLLLDEPTEGLDAACEAVVIDRLRSRLARSGQGAIIVSHRPAVLDACTIVLDWSIEPQRRTVRAPAVSPVGHFRTVS